MPNWCSATVDISATEKEIKRLKRAIKDGNKEKAEKGLLNAMVPQPVFENDQDWYGWNVENWGTKWEVGHIQISDESKTSLTLTFDTAWGPAVQAFQTWAEQDPDTRDFTYKYYEPGMAFLGTAGPGYDDYVSNDDDSLEYRRIAEEEWGEDFSWQDEEEEDEDEEDDSESDFGDDQTASDLVQALEQLRVELDAISVNQDPVLTMLREDFDRLQERVKTYKEKTNE